VKKARDSNLRHRPVGLGIMGFQDALYELRIPYSDPRELMMDVLKHGTEVEVIEPTSLREMINKQLRQAAQQYENNDDRLAD
ncbi:MAG: WYL domain-containing protein, partial [Gallionella sp.]